ncbi:MAG: thermonuclease family protein [Alphaproteobacteria bacterium]
MKFLGPALILAFAAFSAQAADETAKVIGSPDGRTLFLESREQARLDGVAALDIPDRAEEFDRCLPSLRGPDAVSTTCDLKLAMAARNLLRQMTEGKDVRLSVDPQQRDDRHGRVLAQVYAPDGHGGELWTQEKLLAAGLAYIRPPVQQEAALPALLKTEAAARAAKIGIWQLPEFHPIPPEDAAQYEGRHVFIEGVVLKAAKTRNKIYLNFGHDWRHDFTAIIEKEDWKKFAKAETDVMTFENRKIRVRGIIYQDNGPMMRIASPWQIDVVE